MRPVQTHAIVVYHVAHAVYPYRPYGTPYLHHLPQGPCSQLHPALVSASGSASAVPYEWALHATPSYVYSFANFPLGQLSSLGVAWRRRSSCQLSVPSTLLLRVAGLPRLQVHRLLVVCSWPRRARTLLLQQLHHLWHGAVRPFDCCHVLLLCATVAHTSHPPHSAAAHVSCARARCARRSS